MLKIAMIMADFSGAEAEELRRALSFHRSRERMEKVSVKLRAGLEKNGVAPEVIVKIIQAISSFALYGFPESHAISFAILAYGSAYLKVHRAAEFYASLLNNQPMGFYTPGHDREGRAPARDPDAAGLCRGVGMALRGGVG